MEIQQNVLYVMTQGAYVKRDHLAVQVEVDGAVRLGVPLHNLQALVLFGHVMISPSALSLCAEAGVSVTFLTEVGRLQARVDAPVSGNVLLRREQYRQADNDGTALKHARCFVAGKLQNARAILLRAGRDDAAAEDRDLLLAAAAQVASGLRHLETSPNLDEVRGIEGSSARVYFAAFPSMIRHERELMAPQGRTRRPPLDRGNAMLSFAYALLLADCAAALAGVGLDPNVGFLHADRPGKPSLALDLMEEFRPLLADRLVLALLNRRQVSPKDFQIREGGAVEMSAETRKLVVASWQERKQEIVTHPLLGRSSRVGLLPHLQARILARVIRGEMEEYVPCILK
jgi:CRISPR-associated protein Cas1